jgi:hypothetical protein
VKEHRRQMKRLTMQTRLLKYKAAFEKVTEIYYEVKSVSYTSSCTGFYDRIANQTASASKRVGRVTVSPLDLIADVELAAKSVLTPMSYSKFMRGVTSVEDKIRIGRVFVARKIHPLHKYLQPKDVR